MKALLIAALVIVLAGSCSPKVTPQVTPTPVVKTEVPDSLKNKVDSVSYAIGFMVANFYKNQQGIQELNADVVAQAVKDIYNNRPTLLNESQSNNTLMRFLNPALDKTIAEGEAFLKENGKRPGVITTASGLQYEVLVQGTGIKPAATDTVVAHYAGRLLNGEEFDNSYKRGQPLTIGASQVIKGWTEALTLMPVGSKYKIYIPHDIGYGMNDQGPIPGGSVLVFEVELLAVKKAK